MLFMRKFLAKKHLIGALKKYCIFLFLNINVNIEYDSLKSKFNTRYWVKLIICISDYCFRNYIIVYII